MVFPFSFIFLWWFDIISGSGTSLRRARVVFYENLGLAITLVGPRMLLAVWVTCGLLCLVDLISEALYSHSCWAGLQLQFLISYKPCEVIKLYYKYWTPILLSFDIRECQFIWVFILSGLLDITFGFNWTSYHKLSESIVDCLPHRQTHFHPTKTSLRCFTVSH